MLNITNTPQGIVFDWGGATNRSTTVPHGEIKGVKVWQEPAVSTDGILSGGYDWLEVYASIGVRPKFRWQYDVATPVTASADDLRTLLLTYNLGYSAEDTYTAAVGQTIFTTTNDLTATVVVFVNGALIPSGDYTYTVGGTTLTFVTPMIGGETVTILTI